MYQGFYTVGVTAYNISGDMGMALDVISQFPYEKRKGTAFAAPVKIAHQSSRLDQSVHYPHNVHRDQKLCSRYFLHWNTRHRL